MDYSGDPGDAWRRTTSTSSRRRAQDGDRDALEPLLTAVRPRALNVCRGVLPYSADAEDACQEALLNVATKIGSWGRRGRFTTWLHVVAVNSARSTYRRLKNQAIADRPEDRARRAPDPRTTSVIAGTRLDLLEAMETLERDHPQFVEPLLLRDVYGLPYDEIARSSSAHRSAPSRRRSTTAASWPGRCCAESRVTRPPGSGRSRLAACVRLRAR